MTRLLRLLAVAVLVLTGTQLGAAPTGAAPTGAAPTRAAQRADAVALAASAPSVAFGKELVLTASVGAPQAGAQVDFYAKNPGGQDRLLGTAATGTDSRGKLSLPVVRTATYYAVLLVNGVLTAQSTTVDVVVAPELKLTAARVIGPVYHFTAKVKPAVDGIPLVLQRLVGGKWKKVEKSVSEGGERVFNADIPADQASRWRVFVRGSTKYGEAASKSVRVVDN